MKKFVIGILLSLILLSQSASYAENGQNTTKQAPQKPKFQGMTFQAAINDTKPSLVLIYASWGDDAKAVLSQFLALRKIYGSSFNYVLLDIASEQTKEFNKTFVIQPNLPYLMMFKSKGKVSRYVPKSCILDNACILKTTKSFGN